MWLIISARTQDTTRAHRVTGLRLCAVGVALTARATEEGLWVTVAVDTAVITCWVTALYAAVIDTAEAI